LVNPFSFLRVSASLRETKRKIRSFFLDYTGRFLAGGVAPMEPVLFALGFAAHFAAHNANFSIIHTKLSSYGLMDRFI
jgi:hypothetical protein